MLSICIIFLLITLDHVTKYFALSLKNSEDIVLINNKLKFTYVENRGAAFGIFNNQAIFLNVLTIGITIALCLMLYRHYQEFTKTTIVCFSMIIGGSLGNLIDRLIRTYVVDFISYTFYNGYHFPVFNIADICVVLGCIGLLISTYFTNDLSEVI